MNIATTQQYDGKSRDYDNFRPTYSNRATTLIAQKLIEIDMPSGVDIGAGTGSWTRQIFSAMDWKKFIAIEPNHALLKFAQNNMSHRSSLGWIQAYGEYLPLQHNFADFISMASVLNWLDINKALLEVNRVLKRKGILCLLWNPIKKDTNNLILETELFLEKLMGERYLHTQHKKIFLSENLYKFLKAANFSIIEDYEFYEIHKITTQNMKYLWTYTNKIKMQLKDKKYAVFLKFLNEKFTSDVIQNYTCLTKCWLAHKL